MICYSLKHLVQFPFAFVYSVQQENQFVNCLFSIEQSLILVIKPQMMFVVAKNYIFSAIGQVQLYTVG